MGHPLRIHHPGLIYHVINRGNNRQVIFLEKDDFRDYLNLLTHYKKKYAFNLFAYCLMTNHVHLMIQVTNDHTISKIMQSITIAHTKRYHFKYQVSGHVWQGRFKSPIVGGDDHVMRVMQYIEQNPVRARMVERLDEYQWSSYKLNIRLKESKMIDRDKNEMFQRLGENDRQRSKVYKENSHEYLEIKDLHRMQKAFVSKAGYMSDKFKNQIEAMLPKKRKRGRPRKKQKSCKLLLFR